MRRIVLLIYAVTLCSLFKVTIAQNISINSAGSAPSSSAILDISANDKGILIPRMTNTQRQALKDPATGLIIYNTTSNQLNYYNGSGWHSIPNNNVSSSSGSGTASGGNTAINTTGLDADPSAILDIASTNKGLLIPRTTQSAVTPIEGLLIYNTSTNTIDYYNGSAWNALCTSFLDNTIGLGASAHGIGINTSGASPDASAILDIASTDKGLLIPRMSSVQRNSIQSPATGLMLYNSTTDRIENWDGSAWYELLKSTDTPSSPTASSHDRSETQIIWNWNTVAGATGYKYNTVNNYATATDNGTSTSHTQTSLTCNTAYTLYVWAYSTCGNSSSTTLNESTSACYIGCFKSGTVIQDVTNTYTGDIWMDRNLGASRVALSKTDALAYGDLYQWGRCPDGHEIRTSPTISTLASTAVPNLGNAWDGRFIANTTHPSDWLSTTNNTLWQGTGGTNNPCPSGYRLPTAAELDAERLSWVQPPISSSDNSTGAFASPLKLPTPGFRDNSGALIFVGMNAIYWSSTVPAVVIPQHANRLWFNSSSTQVSNSYRSAGSSIRCIKD